VRDTSASRQVPHVVASVLSFGNFLLGFIRGQRPRADCCRRSPDRHKKKEAQKKTKKPCTLFRNQARTIPRFCLLNGRLLEFSKDSQSDLYYGMLHFDAQEKLLLETESHLSSNPLCPKRLRKDAVMDMRFGNRHAHYSAKELK